MPNFDTDRPVPLLILGDGPDQKTGLGRIGHDLAWVLSSMPEFRVGYLGRMAFGRAKYPWTQYSFGPHEQWGELRLEEAWRDLSRGDRGIVFTVWDASRLLWLADPKEMPAGLQQLINDKEFERWGYFMCDGSGADPACLPLEQAYVLDNFDRVLLASRWGYDLATGRPLRMEGDVDWLPHGINTKTFRPRDRAAARSFWDVKEKDTVIGCVMANQQRKHWPVVMEAVSRLRTPSKPYLWIHTDKLVGYWNIPALAIEYGMEDHIFTVDRPLSDEELAMRYSGCDATVLMSGGEGFGYPVAESLACGCPVVTGLYGAASELIGGLGVRISATMLDTSHGVRRAYYNANEVRSLLASAVGWDRELMRKRTEHLEWERLSVQWKKWFRRGLTQPKTEDQKQL